MSQNNQISLPISLGEAIDKLTILDIKLDKIKDSRVIDVKKEYDLLHEKLDFFLTKYNELYQSMKKVNTLIWDMMDSLRDSNIDENTYLKICRRCIEYNDIRFRVKNKINYVSESYLKEQKSYSISRLLVEINNLDNITEFIKPIKYYSLLYDEIIIVCNNADLKNMFSYDPTVLFQEKFTDNESKKKYIFSKNSYDKETIYEIFELNDNIMNSIL